MSTQTAAHDSHAHVQISGAKYIQIAVILFILTGLEVALYEVAHEAGATGFPAVLAAHFVGFLLALSAAKFWFVAMFYMHLKNDEPVLSWIFLFSLVIASVVILGLITLFWYLFHHGI
jgi:hypothetical protein